MSESNSPPRRRARDSRSPDDRRRRAVREDDRWRKDDDRSARRKHYRSRSRSRSRDRDRDRARRRSRSPEKSEHRRERSRDRRSHHRRSRSRSRSPRRKRSPEAFQRSKGPLPSQVDAFKTTTNKDSPSPVPEKQKPNFRPSGLLAKAANTVATSSGAIVLKYHEPPEARKPPSSQTWRLYVFKGDEILDTLDLYTQSCWLFGREVSVCDYALEHPSCSKQHAVIQFRYIERRNEFGDKIGKVKPYVIDLESANGTKVNDEAIPEGRYVELRDKDVIKFGHSTREYVVQLPPR
ncbi:Smad nuclear-interacting protein 1 [Exophiala dermatitidis]